MTWDQAVAAACAHLEACYPLEGCGFIVPMGQGFEARPFQNAADTLHREDPQRYPRTARTSFALADADVLSALQGDSPTCLFHSHPDGSAELSPFDRSSVLTGGQPMLPGVGLLVISVVGGRAERALLHSWVEGEGPGRFLSEPVQLQRRDSKPLRGPSPAASRCNIE